MDEACPWFVEVSPPSADEEGGEYAILRLTRGSSLETCILSQDVVDSLQRLVGLHVFGSSGIVYRWLSRNHSESSIATSPLTPHQLGIGMPARRRVT